MGHTSANAEFLSLHCSVLTVSDSRSEREDESGNGLVQRLTDAGHRAADKVVVQDDVYQIRAVVSRWIADPEQQVVLVTGGTGLTGRDVTPEALRPLFDKEVPGFGELFRWLSYNDIGTSTVQSRALAGLANGTLLFCMPGSPRGALFAWDRILAEQLDSRTRPCNFVALLPRFTER